MIASLAACAAVFAAFLIARRIAHHGRHHPLLNPILLAAAMIGASLWLSGLPVARFTELTQPLRWLLGPAIVALGHLIWSHRAALGANARPLAIAIIGGSLTGITSAVSLARVLDLDLSLQHALAPKSATSPFAIALMERLGGSPELAAGLVIVTGIIGAILVPPILKALRLDDPETEGVAVGQSAHIVGTDALSRRSAKAAAFSGLTMALAGIATAILLPLLWGWLI
ncbi:LrgB family protein [Sphingoaurantiacus capsulatus]|uniref:LrgB family protein n=1 Tax=Sphingoaurantiacus capsulatus TaxID=1771310 RepID=A0ABV7XAE0_9SPHN